MGRNLIILLAAFSLLSAVLGACLMWAFVFPNLGKYQFDCGQLTPNKNQGTTGEHTEPQNFPAGAKNQKSTPPNSDNRDVGSEKTNNGENADYACELTAYTGTVATFTIVLAVATVFLGIISLFGIYLTWSDTRVLQRAHLNVIPLGIRPYSSEDGRLASDVGFQNTGHLPARNVKWKVLTKFSCNAEEADFPLELKERPLYGDNIIPPGETMRKGRGYGSITITEFNDFVGAHQIPDKSWLYVYGRVEYLDGFNTHRFRDFCFRYNLVGICGDKVRKGDGRQHENGNHTDED